MLKREKEVIQYQLDNEKEVISALEREYEKALWHINQRIRMYQADEQTLSRIHHINYQKELRRQVEAILERLHSGEYETINQYLTDTYTDAFVGTMYSLAGQGVPVIAPLDRNAMVKAVLTDSKISEGLYTSLGVDTRKLKKAISSEISRGLSSGMAYADIARNIATVTGAPKSRAKSIVRTEGHRIQQASTQDAAMASKARGANVKKQWDSTLDGGTRPTHRRLDGQIREVEEPFSMDGKTAMHPGDFGDPAEDCECRCVELIRATKALDASELDRLKERAKFFELDKTEDFEDFKKKYLKAAEMDGKKVSSISIESINKKATEALLDAYDERRKHFGLRTTPAEELRENPINSVTANYTGLSVQTADAFNDTITALSSEYYTGFTRIEVADPKKIFGSKAFASTIYSNSVDQKVLEINPLKTKDYDKLVKRIEELKKSGHAVKFAEGKAGEYAATHEFGHSFFNMQGSLKNYVGLDEKPIKKARKEIEGIFARYTKEVGELEKAYKGIEGKFMLADDLDEMEALQTKVIAAKTALERVKISGYSMSNADEFMAEAFTQARIGTIQSPYTVEVMKVIDGIFKK